MFGPNIAMFSLPAFRERKPSTGRVSSEFMVSRQSGAYGFIYILMRYQKILIHAVGNPKYGTELANISARYKCERMDRENNDEKTKGWHDC